MQVLGIMNYLGFVNSRDRVQTGLGPLRPTANFRRKISTGSTPMKNIIWGTRVEREPMAAASAWLGSVSS